MLLYAYDENKNIVPINKAQKQTDYYCPECGAVLRIKDGEIKCKHYFHLNVGDCGATGESLAHKYFKEHITDFIDDIEIKYNTFEGKQIETYKIVSFETEQRLSVDDTVIIPDVLATLDNGDQVAIEIYYSHKKNQSNIDKYNKLGMIAVEIEIDIEMDILDIQTIAHPKQFQFDSFTYVVEQVINADYSVSQLDYFIQKLTKEKTRKERIAKAEEHERLFKQLVENGSTLVFYNPFNDKEIEFDDIKAYKDENDKWQLAKITDKGIKKLNKHQGTKGNSNYYYWNIHSEKIYELDLQSLNNGYSSRRDFTTKMLNGMTNDKIKDLLVAIFKVRINDFMPKEKQTDDNIQAISNEIKNVFDKKQKENYPQDKDIALLIFNFKNGRNLERNRWYNQIKHISAETINDKYLLLSKEQQMLVSLGLTTIEDYLQN